MPYPNHHAARLRDPGDFDADSYRTTKGGTMYGSKKVPATVLIVWGKLKDKAGPSDQPIPQSLRFPTESWTAAEAKKWLNDNEIKTILFEPASEGDSAKFINFEVRGLPGLEIIRRDGEAVPLVIRGYAAVFDKLSEPLGPPSCAFREKIARGAFSKVLAAAPDVRALVNHDVSQLLGRTKSGTLKVAEDNNGLAVEINPPDTQVGRDVVESIKRRDLDGMSFMFRVAGERWEHAEGQADLRTITEVSELFDVGPVTFPAYPDTSVAVRSRDLWRAAEQIAVGPDLETMLREQRQREMEIGTFD
jgi:HK97 family phage prohead protease